ncbi:uncharacterized protein PpBr36_09644 [Pyricularia pennisetigena]|uniref:uncharacterized protein n=1 Tax=Pyricularia pennisetigena TaxID=1578925 RepID=UPI0011508962|nr:uncharacterized protein PpBr36_09644 [Pyricularia pennisetigena]TLS21640.1 hypothetical protein PpBr36_09644 [Pyricularia pennisetigena]
MFSLKTVVLALAATAFVQAAPAEQGPSLSMAMQKCGSEKVVSCCNSKKGNSMGGLAGELNVLGGECKVIPINVLLNNLVPVNKFCSDTVMCCSGDQFGLVNIHHLISGMHVITMGMMVEEDVWSSGEGAWIRRSALSESWSWRPGALVSS